MSVFVCQAPKDLAVVPGVTGTVSRDGASPAEPELCRGRLETVPSFLCSLNRSCTKIQFLVFLFRLELRLSCCCGRREGVSIRALVWSMSTFLRLNFFISNGKSCNNCFPSGRSTTGRRALGAQLKPSCSQRAFRQGSGWDLSTAPTLGPVHSAHPECVSGGFRSWAQETRRLNLLEPPRIPIAGVTH